MREHLTPSSLSPSRRCQSHNGRHIMIRGKAWVMLGHNYLNQNASIPQPPPPKHASLQHHSSHTSILENNKDKCRAQLGYTSGLKHRRTLKPATNQLDHSPKRPHLLSGEWISKSGRKHLAPVFWWHLTCALCPLGVRGPSLTHWPITLPMWVGPQSNVKQHLSAPGMVLISSSVGQSGG